jgi:hypothetical protein
MSATRRYIDETNVLETTFTTASGTIRITDLMPVDSDGGKARDLRPEHEVLRKIEAVRQFESLLKCANDVGLFAEETDPSSRAALGNFPQALTHVGLINAVQQEHRGRRIGCQCSVTHISDNADDLGKRLIRPVYEDVPPKYSAVSKVPLRKRLVHDQDTRTGHPVSTVGWPAFQNRDAHRSEVPTTDERALRRQRSGRIPACGVFFEPEAGSTRHAPQRQELDRPRGLHTRHAFDAFENLIDDGASCFWRSEPEEKSHRERLGRLKTQVDAGQTRERA